MKQPTVMGHKFSQVPSIRAERSSFNRSHGIKTTFDAGLLIPIYVDEVLPGDTFNARLSFFGRLSTPLKPVMDNLFLDTFFFFVPLRLIWANVHKFMGEQDNPGDSIAYTVPTIPMVAGGPEVGTLADYFGLPTDVAGAYSVASLHFRAYNLIWNEWFRDENLQNSLIVDVDDGPDTYADYVVKRRGKRHDYFTSCLPWPQKGATAQSLPLGTYAPVVTTDVPVRMKTGNEATARELTVNGADDNVYLAAYSGATDAMRFATPTGLQADLTNATAATINQLRQAMLYQAFLERDARGGTRLIEIIKSQFGVTSDDARLQRPEYLGGGSSAINVHPVPQTSVAAGTPQGNLAAFGTVSGTGHGFSKAFTEHGVIIGLANVRADLTYSQGIERMWSRSTRYDFGWPILMGLGEQSVLNKEIYAQGDANDALVFGYQGRYDEYRYKQSKITGVFRGSYVTPLDTWHLSQEFTSLPALNDTFIQDDPPIDRVIAVATEPHILFDGYMNLRCARVMPTFSVPGMGGRL